VVIVLLCFFVGMRILYGYWPWQEGPNRHHARSVRAQPDTAATLISPELVAAPALEPDPEIKERQSNGTAVFALALPPNADPTQDSFGGPVI
jgi:hypothetical protein